MAITKLTGFTAEAEVLGRMVRVQFSEEGLLIEDLSQAEAMEALDKLANRSLVGVNPAVALQQMEAPRPPRVSAPSPRKNGTKEHSRSSEDLPQQPVKEPPLPASLTKGAPEDPALEFPPKPSAPRSPAPVRAAPAPAAVVPEGVPDAVAKSARFIEVLEWVMKSKNLKATQVEEIVAAVELLKELPAVRRVRDIRDKVTANLEAYAEAGVA